MTVWDAMDVIHSQHESTPLVHSSTLPLDRTQHYEVAEQPDAAWVFAILVIQTTILLQSIPHQKMPSYSSTPYGAPFSHLFTELKISPIEVHISAIQLQISPIHLKISSNQLEISTIKPIWRYLQLIWRYLQMNWRYLQIGRIWRYLQFIWRYLQIDKSDTISAPRRKNHCAMSQVNGLIKSCRPLYKEYTLLLIIFWIIIIIDTSVKEVFDTATHSRIGDNTLLRRIISDTTWRI